MFWTVLRCSCVRNRLTWQGNVADPQGSRVPLDGCYGNQPPPLWCSARERVKVASPLFVLVSKSAQWLSITCTMSPPPPSCQPHSAQMTYRSQFPGHFVSECFLQLRRWPTFALSPAEGWCTLAWFRGTTAYVTRLPAAPPRAAARAGRTLWGVCIAIFMIMSLRCVSVCVCRWNGWCTG